MSLNKIIIQGRTVREPELRHTKSQKPVANFTLAVDRDFADSEGKKAADFIDCIAWGKTAEFVRSYFTKGQMCIVSGRLELRDWTDRDGNKRRSAEVVAENVYFGESKKAAQSNGHDPEAVDAGYSDMEDADGELPF